MQHRDFKIGDLVLKENQNVTTLERSQRGKFAPNWMGPYIITHKYGSGAYRLSSMDGIPEAEPLNALHLRPFYC